MKKTVLRFREIDRDIFKSIKNGTKTIETRAATAKFHDLDSGDQLLLVCASERLEKIVKKSRIFASLDDLFEAIDYKKIMPTVTSADEAKQVYFSFPEYQEKIAKFGIIALELL